MEYLDREGGKYLATKLKSYVDNKVTGLPSGTVDLTNYYTKEETDQLLANLPSGGTGTKGDKGDAGVGVSSIKSVNYELIITLTDGTVHNLGNIRGEKGAKGEKGAQGTNGVSPTVSVTETTNGHTVAITDVNGTQSFNVLNGKDGTNSSGGGNVDLSNYYTKEETNALIPSTEGLATKTYVDNAVSNIPTTDLSNYYTKNETYSKTEVDTLVANSGGSSSGSASGITYAYDTEIATGETWIDGKPIYLKVFHINGSSSQPSSSIIFLSYKEQNKFAETIVSVTPVWKSGTRVITGNTIDITDMVSNVTSANDNIVQRTLNCWVDNDAKFTINISKGKRVYSFGCDVFVKYTKL